VPVPHDSDTSRPGAAQTVVRAADLLGTIGRAGEASFSELTRATGLANPTPRRLLVSLIGSGLVTQDEARGRYRLGPEIHALGQLARPSFGFHDFARDSLSTLAEFSGDTAFPSALDGFSTVCLHGEEGRHPIRTHVLNVSDRHPLGLGAASPATLAAIPEADAARTLAVNADRIHARFPEIEIERLQDLVADARPTGVALNPGLVFPGSWGIAVAIRAPSGEGIGAVTIAAIESRMTRERQAELRPQLVAEAGRIEKLMVQFGTAGPFVTAAE
jgi:DNA-binding IclR family transcriptional regulator